MRGLVCTSRDPVQLCTRQEPDQMTHQELPVVQQTGLKPLLLPKAQEPVIFHRRALVLDEVLPILLVNLFKRTSPACRSSSIKTAERGTVPISVYGFAHQDIRIIVLGRDPHVKLMDPDPLFKYRLVVQAMWCILFFLNIYFSFCWSKKVPQWSENFTFKHSFADPFIPDPNFSIPDPGSKRYRISFKEIEYFEPPSKKKILLRNLILEVYPGSGSWFFSFYPSRISDPDPQHCWNMKGWILIRMKVMQNLQI